jgi:predicted DNA-binding ArsR family transcriptional regulator
MTALGIAAKRRITHSITTKWMTLLSVTHNIDDSNWPCYRKKDNTWIATKWMTSYRCYGMKDTAWHCYNIDDSSWLCYRMKRIRQNG